MHAPAGGGQDGGGDGSPMAGSAVHPHFAVRNLVDTAKQFVQRDVDGAVDVGLVPFQGAAYVQQHDGPVVAHRGVLGERGDRERAQRIVA